MADYNVTKLKTYLLENVLQEISEDITRLNINFLSNNAEDYSLVRVPVQKTTNKWIIDVEPKREVYNLLSRLHYTSEVNYNLNNIGFYEKIEKIIESNNVNKILPNIDGIESIECLDCGALIDRDTDTALFSIQIQIIYREEIE